MDENKDVQQTEQQDKQPAPLSEARKTALLERRRSRCPCGRCAAR